MNQRKSEAEILNNEWTKTRSVTTRASASDRPPLYGRTLIYLLSMVSGEKREKKTTRREQERKQDCLAREDGGTRTRKKEHKSEKSQKRPPEGQLF